MPLDEKSIRRKIEKHNIGGYTRHIFLCTGPSCCSESTGKEAWDQLKKSLKEKDPEKRVFRTKVSCLRICKQGPIALVYPEGTWYGGVQKKVLDKIIESHLLGGQPVDDYVFASNPLAPSGRD